VTPRPKRTHAATPNIVTGRQLRAARILAGLTQKQLAQAAGVHERAARYWELKKNRVPVSAPRSAQRVEAVLRSHGVIVFASPTPGVRLVSPLRKLAVERLISNSKKADRN
jgi:transcriptional regulator with XRE-family HTH domain